MQALGITLGEKIPVDLRRAIDQQEWTVSGKTHVFYSNRELAKFLWKEGYGDALTNTNYITIEDTPGGNWLSNQKLNDETRQAVWNYASHKFALSAKGSIVAFVHEANNLQLFKWMDNSIEPSASFHSGTPERVMRDPAWHSAELPTIIANRDITAVNKVPTNTLRDYFSRSPEPEIAIREITRDLGKASLALPASIVKDSTPSGWTPPTPTGIPFNAIANRPLINPSSSAVTVNLFSSTSQSLHASLERYDRPLGGIVSHCIANVPGKIESLEILSDAVIRLNGKYTVEHELNPEEVLTLADSIFGSGLGVQGLGAVSQNETYGVELATIVGATLKAADEVLGEITFGWNDKLPKINRSSTENPLDKLLLEIKSGDKSIIRSLAAASTMQFSPRIFWEVTEVEYNLRPKTTILEPVKISSEFHFALSRKVTNGLSNILPLDYSQAQGLDPISAKQFSRTRDNFSETIKKEPILACVSDYFAVAALFRRALLSNAKFSLSGKAMEREIHRVSGVVESLSTNPGRKVPSQIPEIINILVPVEEVKTRNVNELSIERAIVAYSLSDQYGYLVGRQQARESLISFLMYSANEIGSPTRMPLMITKALEIALMPPSLDEVGGKLFQQAIDVKCGGIGSPQENALARQIIYMSACLGYELPFIAVSQLFDSAIQSNDAADAGYWWAKINFSSDNIKNIRRKCEETAEVALKTFKGTEKLELVWGVLASTSEEWSQRVSRKSVNFDLTNLLYRIKNQFNVSEEELQSLINGENPKNPPNIIWDSADRKTLDNSVRLNCQVMSQLDPSLPTLANLEKVWDPISIRSDLDTYSPNFSKELETLENSDMRSEAQRTSSLLTTSSWGTRRIKAEAKTLKLEDSYLDSIVDKYDGLVREVAGFANKYPAWIREDSLLLIRQLCSQFRRSHPYATCPEDTLIGAVQDGAWDCDASAVLMVDCLHTLGIANCGLVIVPGHMYVGIEGEIFDSSYRVFLDEDQRRRVERELIEFDMDGGTFEAIAYAKAASLSINSGNGDPSEIITFLREISANKADLKLIESLFHESKGELPAALGHALVSRALSPRYLGPVRAAAQIFEELGVKDKARQLYEAVRQRDPTDYRITLYLGGLALQEENIPRARELHFEVLQTLLRRENFIFTIDQYWQNSLKNLEPIFHNLNVIEKKRGEIQLQILHLSCFLALSPESLDHRFGRASAFFEAGQTTPAIKDMEYILSQDSNNLKAFALRSLYRFAETTILPTQERATKATSIISELEERLSTAGISHPSYAEALALHQSLCNMNLN